MAGTKDDRTVQETELQRLRALQLEMTDPLAARLLAELLSVVEADFNNGDADPNGRF
jgi:hypothetical protein